MADLVITPANTKKVAGATIDSTAVAGETVTAGQYVYKKAGDGKYWKCDNNVDQATSGFAVQTGVALHGASADQPLAVQVGGDVTIGAAVVVGEVYVQSTTAGGIAPLADLASTNYVTYVGYGVTTGNIRLLNLATGLQKA